MLTAKECAQFLRYCARYPIDDESNAHVPIAQLCALHANMNREHGSKPYLLKDFMAFYPKDEDKDLEDEILHGDW